MLTQQHPQVSCDTETTTETMALATPSLLTSSESSMQNYPYTFRSFHHEEKPASQISFLDSGLIASLPPALLPSGVFNAPPYFTPVEFYKLSNGAMRHSVSTPVMHPNLVSTLKSLIAPSTPMSSPEQCGRTGTNEGSSNDGRNGTRRMNDRCKRKHSLDDLELQERLCNFLSSSNQSLNNGGRCDHHGAPEDDEAAVVPVDLIRNRRPFKCAYSGCNKTFKNPQTMKMHHKTHYSDDSAYRLGVNAHVLSTFKAGHNKKIPSRCPICKKTFVGLYELRRHFGRKHSEGEKTFGCKKCGKKFYIEVDLRDHEKLCGEPMECKCGMKFAFKCNLVAHKKGHPECQDRPSSPTSEEDQSPAAPRKQKQRQKQFHLSWGKEYASHRNNSAAPAATGSRFLTSSEHYPTICIPISSNDHAAVGPATMHLANITTPPLSLPHLMSPLCSPLGSFQEFSGAISGDAMRVSSSECSYSPLASTLVTSLSSWPCNFMV